MENLATPAEMVEAILSDAVLQSQISAGAFIELLLMAYRQV